MEKEVSYMAHICSCKRPIFELRCSINGRSCPEFGLPTLYNKHIKQNKLSLESLYKNKFEIFKSFVFKTSPCKKAINSHDVQIEFDRKIDRTTQGCYCKILSFNRPYLTEDIKSKKSSKSVFHFWSRIQKFTHGHNKKRFGFSSSYGNCFIRGLYQKKEREQTQNKYVLKTDLKSRLEIIKRKNIPIDHRLIAVRTFFLQFPSQFGQSNLVFKNFHILT